MKKKVLLMAFLCHLATLVFAQANLNGIVVNKKGSPISDAVVAIEGTNFATFSAADGTFDLQYKPSPNQVLTVYSVGYEKKKSKVENLSKEGKNQIMVDENLINLNPVVVTGTGTHNRLKNSPVQTEVISKKEIKNTGSVTFEDALFALNPSISAKGASGFIVNGLGNKNVLILVNGKKLAGDTGGDTDLSRIDMSKVRRIEIVKGASSALYGSDAMGGVINLITDTPAEEVSVTSISRISRYGQFYQSLGADLQIGKLSSTTQYQRTQTDGWQLHSQEISGGKLKDTEKQAVTGYHSDVYNQRFVYKPVDHITLNAHGSYYQKTTDRARSAYTYDMYYKDYNLGAGANYRLKNKKGYIGLDTYFDNYEYYKDYFKDGKTYKVGDRDMTKRQRYTNTILKGVFNIHANHKLNTGFDFTTDYLRNPGNLEKPESAYTLAFYAQDEMKIVERLSAVVGFRALHHETFKNRFVPSVSTMYAFDNFNFRASYSSGFRAPNLMELFYDSESSGGSTISKGNKNLKPEKSNYVSLNVEYHNSRMSISATAYMNFVKDIIERKNATTPADKEAGITRYHYENVAKAKTQGVDVNMKFLLCEGFTLGANYSYLDAENQSDKTRLFGSSRHTATVSANWNKEWNKYNLNVNFNGRLQTNTYFPNMNARTYQLWNIATTHRFDGVRKFTPEIGLGVENIFNFKDKKPFGSRYATTSPGTSVFASLMLNI